MVNIYKNRVKKFMRKIRYNQIPTSEQIVMEAFKKSGIYKGKVKREDVRENFDIYFKKVWDKTLGVLEDYEAKVYPESIPVEIAEIEPSIIKKAESIAKSKSFLDGVKFFFNNCYPYLREAFLSVSQSRKARGGKDFENTFAYFLELMDIPYDVQEKRYRVDFVLPSKEKFKENSTVSIIVSAKRTLRERWQEVVEELYKTKAPNVFLLTADEDISKGQVDSISDYNIQLLVWDRIKAGKFPDKPLVIGFSEWISSKVEVLEKFW